MIHSEKTASFRQLERVKVERPENAGAYWVGIKHSDLVLAIESGCRHNGWVTRRGPFVLSNDEQDFTTTFLVTAASTDDYNVHLGVITSNARRHALKFFVGFSMPSHKFATVIAEVFVGQKREGVEEFNLHVRISDALEEFQQLARTIPSLIKLWSLHQIAPSAVAQLVFDVGTKEILPWSRVGHMARDLKSDRTMSLFEVFAAFYAAAKYSPPFDQLDQLNEFRKLIHARTPEMGE